MQEKLLRVIEYGSFERVGGSETLHVDVRVVAATNVHLPGLVASGKFRADLLDRLAFDVVSVPPLRARRDDIPRLSEHFATRMTAELGRDFFAGFSERALDTLVRHDWPGNVRELRNAVERSVYRTADPGKKLAHVVLDPFASPFSPVSAPTAAVAEGAPAPAVPNARPALAPPEPASGTGFEAATRAYEARLLQAALESCRFNQAEAARQLGLSYYQFRHHLRVHGMLAEPKKPARAAAE